jgi:hypothetical protein
MKKTTTFAHNKKVVLKWINGHKKLLIAGLLILIVLGGLAGYVGYSISTWNRAFDSVNRTKADIHNQAEALMKNQSVSIQDLRLFEAEVDNTASDICQKTLLIDWQTALFSSAKNTHTTCHQAKEQLITVSSAVRSIIARVEKENGIAKILTEADKQLQKVKSNDFKATIDIWHTTGEKIAKIDADESLSATKKQALDVIHGIEVALDKTVHADQEKKRTEFDEAVAEVEKAYSKLSSVQNISVDSFRKLIDVLDVSTKNLEG